MHVLIPDAQTNHRKRGFCFCHLEEGDGFLPSNSRVNFSENTQRIVKQPIDDLLMIDAAMNKHSCCNEGKFHSGRPHCPTDGCTPRRGRLTYRKYTYFWECLY